MVAVWKRTEQLTHASAQHGHTQLQPTFDKPPEVIEKQLRAAKAAGLASMQSEGILHCQASKPEQCNQE
jgi:hypothetical protein